MGWLGDLGDAAKNIAGGAVALGTFGAYDPAGIKKKIGLGGGLTDADQKKQDNLNSVGAAGMGFAGTAQDNYNNLTGRLNGSLDALQATANGQNSVSAEQLRQGQMSNIAAQQSLAAGAGPQNAAMAARTAANNIARLGYGLSGQQALAGLQERQQAQQAYAQLLGQSRGQDLQGTLGGYGVANSSYGGGLNGQLGPTPIGQIAPLITAAASLGKL